MTTIEDTIRYLDGSLASGQITVSSPPFQFAGIAVASGRRSFPIGPDGTIQIPCFPTIGAQPVGVYYTATYELDKGSVYDEYWLVPSTISTNIPTIRASIPETPSILINAQQLTSAGAVVGQFLGWHGANWAPMWPAAAGLASVAAARAEHLNEDVRQLQLLVKQLMARVKVLEGE